MRRPWRTVRRSCWCHVCWWPGSWQCFRGHGADSTQRSRVLEETLRIPGARAGLDRGYRLKVGLYRRAPGLYLFLYHVLKSR